MPVYETSDVPGPDEAAADEPGTATSFAFSAAAPEGAVPDEAAIVIYSMVGTSTRASPLPLGTSSAFAVPVASDAYGSELAFASSLASGNTSDAFTAIVWVWLSATTFGSVSIRTCEMAFMAASSLLTS